MKRILILCMALFVALIGCDRDEGERMDDERIDKLKETERVVVVQTTYEDETEIINEVTDEKEVKKIIDMMSRATKITGDTTAEGTSTEIRFINENNRILYAFLSWDYGSFGLNDKAYMISKKDKKAYDQLIKAE